MKIQIAVLYLISFFEFSCATQIHSENELIIVDSIETFYDPKTSSIPFLNTIPSNNLRHDSLLTIYCQHTRLLSIYNLEKKELIKSIELKRQIHDQHSNVYISSTGLLYALNTESNFISTQELNNIGNIKKMNIENPKESFEMYTMGAPFRIEKDSSFVFYRGSKLISPIKDKENFREYFSMKIFSSFKIHDDSIHRINNFTEFPKEYLENFYSTFHPSSFLYENDSVVSYIFYKTDCIYSVNIKTGKMVNTIKIKHGDFNQKPFDIKSGADMASSNKYESENKTGFRLFKDKSSDCYLLVVKEPIRFTNDDGTLNEWEDAPFNIYIIDMSGEIKRKIKIPDFIDPRLCIPFNDKLIMRRKDSGLMKYYITKLP